MEKSETKYVAFKVKGLHNWLWFSRANVKEENGKVIGKGGWGEGGEFTEIEVSFEEITGRINSEALQYR